jgi:hypothetical protein
MTAGTRTRRVAAVVLLVAALGMTGALPAHAKPVLTGTPEIKLSTPTQDVGNHPVLRWRKVKGAALYVVVVQTPKGAPYWSWQGEATKIRLGGDSDDVVSNSEGASLERRMVWFVAALDGDGIPIASSARRTIAP